jgi:predicted nucleotidyltransferase
MLDISLGTRTSWKILFVLSEAPGKAVSHKEIRELTKLGNKVITKFLIILKKSDIIIAEKIGKTTYYKMNLNNKYNAQILGLINLEKLSINNLDFKITNILRDLIYALTNIGIELISSVYVFGSYAKRVYNKDSDIDVAIILNEKNTVLELDITAIIDNIEKRYHKEIQPHYYTIKEFSNNKNKLIMEIKKDGIRLM